MRKTITLVLILSVTLSFGARPLQSIDSLKNELAKTNGTEKIETLIHLSEAYRNIHFNDCINFGMTAVDESRLLKDVGLEAKAFKSLGISAYFSGDFDKALLYYQNSHELYDKISNIKGMAACNNNIGLIYQEKAEFTKALEFYRKSFDYEQQLDNKEGMAISLINLGNVNYYLNNFQSALDDYFKSLLIFESLENKWGKAYAYNSLGIIYMNWDKPTKALGYFKKAKELYEEMDDETGLSLVLTNLGELFCNENKNYKKSLEYYNKSLAIKKKQNDKIGIALLYNNFGTVYTKLEDYKRALNYLNRSYALYYETNSITGLIMVDHNIGKVYLSLKDYNTAIEKFNTSLTMAIDVKMRNYISDNYKELMICYAFISDNEKYDKYYTLYNSVSNSSINILRHNKLNEIEAKYNIDLLLMESHNLSEENQKNINEIRQLKLIMATIGGLIILIIFSYVLFLKINK